jgi:hypothetical protein
MEFRLVYRGPLKVNGGAAEKQAIRRVFHPQLRDLWTRLPLNEYRGCLGEPSGGRSRPLLLQDVAGFRFAPLVSPKLDLVARLRIDFLRPQEPGALVSVGGDIDNRVKTLLDALRMPKTTGELPPSDAPRDGETPFFCVLEDDVLVTELAVTTDRLLAPLPFRGGPPADSRPVVATKATWDNIGIG